MTTESARGLVPGRVSENIEGGFMKYMVLRECLINGKHREPDEVVDLDQKDAARLLGMGRVQKVGSGIAEADPTPTAPDPAPASAGADQGGKSAGGSKKGKK